MKLYYSPGACSLADHIALHEADLAHDLVKVDLKAHKTADGDDYYAINPKGYVPALTLDGGETLTENLAILDWIADQNSSLRPAGPLGRTHLLQALAFISTELHKGFKPFFAGGSDEEKRKAGEMLAKRFGQIADDMAGPYIFGDAASVADAYLFVMTLWADKMGVTLPDAIADFAKTMRGRDAVRKALEMEGLSQPA